MPDPVSQILAAVRLASPPIALAAAIASSALIFAPKDWLDVIDPAGLSAHSLRSGFAVSAVRAGVPLPLIQAVTRHTTLAGLEPCVRAAGAPSPQQFEALARPGIDCWSRPS